jgi:hypothetical protein
MTMMAYTYEIKEAQTEVMYGNGHASVDLYIYNTNTGEEKVLRNFTYFDLDESSETYNMDMQILLDELFNDKEQAETVLEKIS